MNKIVKVMGLPRSGTNAMNLIINLNFEHYVCGINYHNVDVFGWKHAKPPQKNILKLVEKRTNNDIKFIFMYRDFEDWQNAVFNRYSGKNSSEFTDYSFGDDGFLFNTPMGAEYYKTMYDFYIERIDLYKEFIKDHPKKGILINYKEIFNQNVLLNKIKEHFDLIPSYEQFINVNKIVTFNNTITHYKK
jgi:hypothetical protein